MRISFETPTEGVAVLHLEGRLDLGGATAVKDEILRAVESGRARVVVDLKGVPFVDSSGLGALIGGLRATRTAGGDLKIASPGAQARMLLELTTLDRVLAPHDNVEAALAS